VFAVLSVLTGLGSSAQHLSSGYQGHRFKPFKLPSCLDLVGIDVVREIVREVRAVHVPAHRHGQARRRVCAADQQTRFTSFRKPEL